MKKTHQNRLLRRSALALAAAAVAAGSLTACGSGESGSSAGLSSFTIGSPLSGTIDPIHSDQEQTDNPDQLFYDSLVSYDATSKMVPRLATSWIVAPDASPYLPAGSLTALVMGGTARLAWAAALGLVILYGAVAAAVAFLAFRTRDIVS